MKLLVINGPNLNMLGIREPLIYGSLSYAELELHIKAKADKHGAECRIMQSNHEGVIIDEIQSAQGVYDGIIINAAAYTHTSIAIADAIASISVPCVEVHLTDIFKREAFRQNSYLGGVCVASFIGRGFESYTDAVDFLCTSIAQTEVPNGRA